MMLLLPGLVADPGGRPPIDLTNFCINVKSNPRMHQNPPFSGKNSIFFLGRGHSPLPLDRPPPHYEILDPPLSWLYDKLCCLTCTLLLMYCLDCVVLFSFSNCLLCLAFFIAQRVCIERCMLSCGVCPSVCPSHACRPIVSRQQSLS